jgi:hypothetical protein
MVDSSGKKLSFIAIKLLIGLVLVLSLSHTAKGQTTTGGIRGVITDSTGAVLPNAKVTAKNLATGLVLQSTSNGEGIYSFPRILPGKYNISIELPSFKKQEFRDVEVLVGKDAVIDASLEPGEISEVLEARTTSSATLIWLLNIRSSPITSRRSMGGIRARSSISSANRAAMTITARSAGIT